MTSAAPASPIRRASAPRRLAAWLHRHPGTRLGLLLSAPLGWLVLAYLGSLTILFINAFWSVDPFTRSLVYEPTLANFERLFSGEVFRTITVRTLGVAAAVTITDAVIAFPIAYYMARVASPRTRGWLVVAVLIPLWSSYLVKVYAWRIILQDNGPLNAVLRPLGLEGPGFTDGEIRLWIAYSYLWLPYMILPIFAGLERIPRFAVRGVGRPRGPGVADVPARRPAAGLSRRGRRVDLHVLADDGRLHRAAISSRASSSSATSCSRTSESRATCPSRRPSRSCRWRS